MSVFNLTDLNKKADESTKASTENNQQQNTPQPTEGPEPTQPATAQTTEQEPQKKVEIVLSGPLGYVYTKALNALLAKEDATATVGYYEDYERRKEEETEDEFDKAFVYVADGSKLTRAEANKAFDDIVKFNLDNPKAKVVVGLESQNGLSDGASLLCTGVSRMNIEVHFRDSTITRAIKALG